MNDIVLNDATLRALAVGIDRLNDGDLQDRKVAREAERALASAGYITANGRCHPKNLATDGYIQGGTYVHQKADGTWDNMPLQDATDLFLDEACTIFLFEFSGFEARRTEVLVTEIECKGKV